jgi:hypothetical protein
MLEQEDRFLSTQTDLAEIKSEMVRTGDRLRRLDQLFAAFRTDYQNA